MSNLINETVIKLKLTDYMDEAFDVIPSNAFINKGRCGVGGTHLELNTDRNTILVVPNTSVIIDKKSEKDKNGILEYPNLFPVYKGVTPRNIADYMLSDIPYKKIMTTPDSLHKIIKAAGSDTDKLFSDNFLLMDESHTVITETYREAMLKAFEQCFSFKNRAYISATPYYFTDPRMKDLNYYRIIFDKPLGTVEVVNTESIEACLRFMLTNAHECPGNLHIFYNSVTEIAEIIRYAGITDCNVFCADRQENKDKIGQFFNSQPTNGQYKKINFYTTSHFEGWSLREVTPTIILVTDVYRPHTRVGISNKGVQAIGRQRVDYRNPETLPKIYHVTNHRNKPEFKNLREFENDYLREAKCDIDRYNEDLKKYGEASNSNKIEYMKTIAEINEETGQAKINNSKIDQLINESACNEEFNHLCHIKAAWERAGYETDMRKYEETIKKDTEQRERKRLTSKSIQDILSDFEALEPKNTCTFFRNEEHEQQLKQLKNKYPALYKAYQMLTREEIKATQYNVKEIEKLVILKNNKSLGMKILKLLPLYFVVGKRYTKEEVKRKLQKIYDETGYEKKATAAQIDNPKWYDVKPCKVKNKQGNYDNGFEIIRMNFKLLVSTK